MLPLQLRRSSRSLKGEPLPHPLPLPLPLILMHCVEEQDRRVSAVRGTARASGPEETWAHCANAEEPPATTPGDEHWHQEQLLPP